MGKNEQKLRDCARQNDQFVEQSKFLEVVAHTDIPVTRPSQPTHTMSVLQKSRKKNVRCVLQIMIINGSECEKTPRVFMQGPVPYLATWSPATWPSSIAWKCREWTQHESSLIAPWSPVAFCRDPVHGGCFFVRLCSKTFSWLAGTCISKSRSSSWNGLTPNPEPSRTLPNVNWLPREDLMFQGLCCPCVQSMEPIDLSPCCECVFGTASRLFLCVPGIRLQSLWFCAFSLPLLDQFEHKSVCVQQQRLSAEVFTDMPFLSWITPLFVKSLNSFLKWNFCSFVLWPRYLNPDAEVVAKRSRSSIPKWPCHKDWNFLPSSAA